MFKCRNIGFFIIFFVLSAIRIFAVDDFAGNCVDLDGLNDYILIPDNNSLDLSTMTIEMWIFLEDTNGINFISGKGIENWEIHTAGVNGSHSLRFIPTDDVYIDTPADIFTSNTWTHLAFSYNPSSSFASCYINGVSTSLTNNGPNPLSTPIEVTSYDLNFGRRYNSDHHYNGKLDEIRIWNDVRSQQEIQDKMIYALDGTEPGLVSYWQFNESSGATASDAVNTNDATLINMSNGDWVNSSIPFISVDDFAGNCLEFDGTNDFVNVTGVVIPASGDFTLSVWAKADPASSGYREIVSQNAGTGGTAFYLGRSTSGNVRVGDSWSNSGVPFPQDGVWHCYSVVKNSANTLLYIDGSLSSAKGSAIVNPAGTEFRIARQYGAYGEYFQGEIDEIRIWNIAQTAQEIQAEMNTALAGTEPGLVTYWQFNEESGTIFPDAVGTNDGTLINMTDDNWIPSTVLIGSPYVTTTTASSIAPTTVSSGGNVLSQGGSAITARGVCWSTSQNPTIAESLTIDGTETGSFTSYLTGLTTSTLYYYRAYATNSLGTSYGEEYTFTTIPPGSGTAEDPYQISILADLNWLSADSNLWDSHFIQTADIDAADTQTWYGGAGFSPIGNIYTRFSGEYNGDGKIISNLYINRSSDDMVGFFGYVSIARIRDLGIEDAQIFGNVQVGGLAGYISAVISNCYSTGTVNGFSAVGGLLGKSSATTSNCYSTAGVNGSGWTGGLVGENHSNAKISNSYSTGSVDGSSWVGGLVGANRDNSKISNCYSTGNVSGNDDIGGLVGNNYYSTISNSYSTGNVSGSGDTGGLVGSNFSVGSFVNDSFWNIQTSGQSTSEGGTGQTTTQMQLQDTFTTAGWDFSDETANGTDRDWIMYPGLNNDFPVLTWQDGIFMADFAATSAGVFNGTEVQFNDYSIGLPDQWLWDFQNDGIYDSFEQNPSYTYPTTGVYSVKLTAFEGASSDTYIIDNYINVLTTYGAPQNVEVTVSGNDVVINWDAVTEDENGAPIIMDGYIINASLVTAPESFFFLYLEESTSLTFPDLLTYDVPKFFFQVIAFKDYSTRQLTFLQNLNSSEEKIKWSEVKLELEKMKDPSYKSVYPSSNQSLLPNHRLKSTLKTIK